MYGSPAAQGTASSAPVTARPRCRMED